jgi:hypothetical protein
LVGDGIGNGNGSSNSLPDILRERAAFYFPFNPLNLAFFYFPHAKRERTTFFIF